MPARPPDIAEAGWNLDRRRLETTLDHDLSSLSLSSLQTTAAESHHSGGTPGASFLSTSTVERHRAFGQGDTGVHDYPSGAFGSGLPQHGHGHGHGLGERYGLGLGDIGPSGTPRAAHVNRLASGMSMMSAPESPRSTEGHHVSAMTLADGVFRHQGAGGDYDDVSEFDPERSLGRLVGELGRVMGGSIPARPTSPFAHILSPPRSPSPLPAQNSKDKAQALNLSFTLSRADALPSPPESNGSHSDRAHGHGHGHGHVGGTSKSTGFTSMARQLDAELGATYTAPGPRGSSAPSRGKMTSATAPAPARRALSDSTTFNVPPARASGSASAKSKKSSGRAPERTSLSVPTRKGDVTADITGMTGLMATPAKGGAFDTIGKNGDVGGDAGASIPQTLATLHARLRALDTEGSLARRRVRELEGELERARMEVRSAQMEGGTRLREVAGEKTALEELVASLRGHLTRLTAELENNKQLVADLQTAQAQRPASAWEGSEAASELQALRAEIERLSREIMRLSGVVEEGLQTRRKNREERTVRIDSMPDTLDTGYKNQERERDEPPQTLIELDEVPVPTTSYAPDSAPTPAPAPNVDGNEPLPSRLRQGVHASASISPTLMPPSVAPPTRIRPLSAAAGTSAGAERSVRHSLPPSATPRTTRVSSGSDLGSGSGSGSDGGSSSKDKSRSRRVRERNEGPASPFPSIRAQDEEDFFSELGDGERDGGEAVSRAGVRTKGSARDVPGPRKSVGAGATAMATAMAGTEAEVEMPPLPPHLREAAKGPAQPQTVLCRVIAELEEDYAHYRSIYAELADQYRVLAADGAGAAKKRQILAQHLKEVIDTLEHKSTQIHELYSLLSFKDRPDDASRGAHGAKNRIKAGAVRTPRDVMRMVRDTLGEEAVRRLQEDGVCAGAGAGLGSRRRHAVV